MSDRILSNCGSFKLLPGVASDLEKYDKELSSNFFRDADQSGEYMVQVDTTKLSDALYRDRFEKFSQFFDEIVPEEICKGGEMEFAPQEMTANEPKPSTTETKPTEDVKPKEDVKPAAETHTTYGDLPKVDVRLELGGGIDRFSVRDDSLPDMEGTSPNFSVKVGASVGLLDQNKLRIGANLILGYSGQPDYNFPKPVDTVSETEKCLEKDPADCTGENDFGLADTKKDDRGGINLGAEIYGEYNFNGPTSPWNFAARLGYRFMDFLSSEHVANFTDRTPDNLRNSLLRSGVKSGPFIGVEGGYNVSPGLTWTFGLDASLLTGSPEVVPNGDTGSSGLGGANRQDISTDNFGVMVTTGVRFGGRDETVHEGKAPVEPDHDTDGASNIEDAVCPAEPAELAVLNAWLSQEDTRAKLGSVGFANPEEIEARWLNVPSNPANLDDKGHQEGSNFRIVIGRKLPDGSFEAMYDTGTDYGADNAQRNGQSFLGLNGQYITKKDLEAMIAKEAASKTTSKVEVADIRQTPVKYQYNRPSQKQVDTLKATLARGEQPLFTGILQGGNSDELDSAIKKLNSEAAKDLVIVVVGHTDTDGTNAYNQTLSLRRAEVAAAYIKANGIEASRVIGIEGRGEEELAIPENGKDGRNRRIEFKLARMVDGKPVFLTPEEYNVINKTEVTRYEDVDANIAVQYVKMHEYDPKTHEGRIETTRYTGPDGTKGEQIVVASAPGKITEICAPEPMIKRGAVKPDANSTYNDPLNKAALALKDALAFVADKKNAAAKLKTPEQVTEALQTVRALSIIKTALENLKGRAEVDSSLFADDASKKAFVDRVKVQLTLIAEKADKISKYRAELEARKVKLETKKTRTPVVQPRNPGTQPVRPAAPVQKPAEVKKPAEVQKPAEVKDKEDGGL